jgi:hypothetical protein
MKKTVFVLTIILVGSFLLFEPASAQQKRHRNTTMSIDDEKLIGDCEQVRIRIGDGETVRSELMQTLPMSAAASLLVRSPQQGGIHVQGWNREEYSIKACLAAAGNTKTDAKAVLDQIKLSIEGGQVILRGPNPEDWIAFLIIQAPNGAVLDLTSTNGPIGVNSFSGNIQARSTNGPVTLNDVGGQVKVEVQNGPITVKSSGGDFRLSAQNGPLTIDLDGTQWSGGELEGRTQNGPLTLKLPDSYLSSVRVDASRHSPVECLAGRCRQAVRTWDRPNVIQFGDSEPIVRLSTVNGPVTIK